MKANRGREDVECREGKGRKGKFVIERRIEVCYHKFISLTFAPETH